MRSLKTHCKILEDCRSCGNLGWARANVAAATRALLGLTSALLVDQIGKKCEILRLFSWSWNRDIFRIFTVHQHQHRPPQQLSRNCRFFYVSPCIHSRPSYTWYFLYFSKCRPIECPMQAEGDKKLKKSEQQPFLSHVFCGRCFMYVIRCWVVKTLSNYAWREYKIGMIKKQMLTSQFALDF